VRVEDFETGHSSLNDDSQEEVSFLISSVFNLETCILAKYRSIRPTYSP
jgi:hypothetical protein